MLLHELPRHIHTTSQDYNIKRQQLWVLSERHKRKHLIGMELLSSDDEQNVALVKMTCRKNLNVKTKTRVDDLNLTCFSLIKNCLIGCITFFR